MLAPAIHQLDGPKLTAFNLAPLVTQGFSSGAAALDICYNGQALYHVLSPAAWTGFQHKKGIEVSSLTPFRAAPILTERKTIPPVKVFNIQLGEFSCFLVDAENNPVISDYIAQIRSSAPQSASVAEVISISEPAATEMPVVVPVSEIVAVPEAGPAEPDMPVAPPVSKPTTQAFNGAHSHRSLREYVAIIDPDMITRIANVNSTVLITGESGCGKEVTAKDIHNNSRRAGQRFVSVNCAAIPEELVESILFGHERGSFTGASERQLGKFELADRGTIFLDEIGDLSLRAQAKILRVLQEREIERLGSGKTFPVDVRLLAATNKDLEDAVAKGKFREDLFFRLNVIPISLPAFREMPREKRLDILATIIRKKVEKYHQAGSTMNPVFSDAAIEVILNHPMPGNMRQLENIVESAIVMRGHEPEILPAHLNLPVSRMQNAFAKPELAVVPSQKPIPAAPQQLIAGAPLTEEYILGLIAQLAQETGRSQPDLMQVLQHKAEAADLHATLLRFNFNRKKAAEHIGISYKTLLNRMKQYGFASYDDAEPGHEREPS